jgi:hypothetical protein
LHGPSAGGRLHDSQTIPQVDDLATPVRVDVEDGELRAGARDPVDGALGDRPRGRADIRELSLGLLVDPVDARARKDVVELVQEQALPRRLELRGWITVAIHDRPGLGLAQRLLCAAVEPLHPRL